MTSEETRRITTALEDLGYRVSMDTEAEDSFTVTFPTRRVRKARVTVKPIDVYEEANAILAKYYDSLPNYDEDYEPIAIDPTD